MPFHLHRLAVAALVVLCLPGSSEAAFTSTVSGDTATMTGDSSGDTLTITASGGLFQHNRAADPGFNSAFDFDTTVAGDQTVADTGTIDINAGGGNDTIAIGNGIDLKGIVDGGAGTDTLSYAAYTTPIWANLGLGITGMTATLG